MELDVNPQIEDIVNALYPNDGTLREFLRAILIPLTRIAFAQGRRAGRREAFEFPALTRHEFEEEHVGA
jgi:hypothetical protein